VAQSQGKACNFELPPLAREGVPPGGFVLLRRAHCAGRTSFGSSLALA